MEKGGNIFDRILEFTKNSEFDAARNNNNIAIVWCSKDECLL